MTRPTELGSGNVDTPNTVTIVHFGSPLGTTYTSKEADNG